MPETVHHVVVVKREWHNAEITIDVTDASIRIAMPLEAFLATLAETMGSPATLLTVAQLKAKLAHAAQVVTTGMKSETARVMP